MTVAPSNGHVILADNYSKRLIIYNCDGQLLRYFPVAVDKDRFIARALPGPTRGLPGSDETAYVIIVGVICCIRLIRLARF